MSIHRQAERPTRGVGEGVLEHLDGMPASPDNPAYQRARASCATSIWFETMKSSDPQSKGARRPRKADIKSLYYITHVDNAPSMLQRGILSHAVVEHEAVPFTPIYDADIVSSRGQKRTPAQTSLWEYANLYFQPRNQGSDGCVGLVGFRRCAKSQRYSSSSR